MEIVLDTCAIIAVIADEPEGNEVVEYTKDCIIISPNVLPFEIANSISWMIRKGILDKIKMIELIRSFQQIPIKLVENNLENVLKIAFEYKIYAYDAFFLETARKLNLPLLTFDVGMKNIAKEIGISLIGEDKNVGI